MADQDRDPFTTGLANALSVPNSGTGDPGTELQRFAQGWRASGKATVGTSLPDIGVAQPNGFRSAAGATFRTIAGALEPLQLPKDVFDALVAGSLDPNTTIKQRMDRLQWANYIPLGNQPQRAATGEEIAGFLGVKNPTAQRWVGVGLDLFADPLIFGSWVGAAGKAAKAAGAVKMGDDLLKAGKFMDEVTSIGGLNRGLSAISPWKRTQIDARMQTVAETLMNTRVFWQKGPGRRTVGDLMLSQSKALELQMPGFGSKLVKLRQLSRQSGLDAAERAEALVDEGLHGILKYGRTTLLQRIGRTLGMHKAADKITDGMPLELAELIQKSTYDFNDRIGWGTRGYARVGLDDEGTLGRELLAMTNLHDRTPYQDFIASSIRKKITGLAESLGWDPKDALAKFDAFSIRIAEADALLGYHLSGASFIRQQFDQMVREFEGPAGAEHAAELWREMLRRGADIQPNETALEASNRFFNTPLREVYESANLPVPKDLLLDGGGDDLVDLTGLVPEVTVGTALERVDTFHSLDFSLFAQGLKGGHMRRAYGIFQDDANFEAWAAALRAGKVVPANLIDKVDLDRMLPDDLEAAQAIRDYLDTMRFDHHGGLEAAKVAIDPGAAPDRGLLVTQAGMAEALAQKLGDPRRAQKALLSLIGHLQGKATPGAARGSSYKDVLDLVAGRIQDLSDEYAAQLLRTQGVGREYARVYNQKVAGFGTEAVSAQRNLAMSRAALEALGELASPAASILEMAQLARTRVPWSEFMAMVETEGRKAGVVGGNGSGFVTVAREPSIWGKLAGERVHPMLQKELLRAMKQRTDQQNGAFNRVKNLITGGYLASPSVITANLAGGLFTYGLLGGNIPKMISSMATTFREFLNSSRDPSYRFDDLDALKHYVSVKGTTMVTETMAKTLDRFRSEAAGVTEGIGTRFVREVTDTLQGQLDAPGSGILPGKARRGLPWAGLDGFQFLENWMKVSIFRTERNTLARAAGIDPADFAKLRRGRVDATFADVDQATGRLRSAEDMARREQMLDIEAKAAEIARIGVFDYSELPDTLRVLRDTGLILFPGFPFFLSGRTINAAINHPGFLGTADRLSDAIATAQLDEESKRLLYASMSDWLKVEDGVPMPGFSYRDADGNVRHAIIPLGGLFPTNTFASNPWGESLLSAGIYKPWVETTNAWLKGDGEAIFSARYGQQVFAQGLPFGERVSQTLGFLFNSLAPGGARKLVNYSPEKGFGGVIPAAMRQAGLIDDGLAGTIYSINEFRNRKADRKLWDEMLAATLRSPQIMTMTGPLANWPREIENSKRRLSESVATLNARAERAVLAGNQKEVDRLAQELADLRAEWVARVTPIIDAAGQYEATHPPVPGTPVNPSLGVQPNQMPQPGQGVRQLAGAAPLPSDTVEP